MENEREYLNLHPTCEMCGKKKAVFVAMGQDKAALCYTCGNAYMGKGHALKQFDSAPEDSGVEDAYQRMKEQEANLYKGM